MKKLLIFLFICLTPSVFSQWTVSHTFNPAQSLQAIRFYDANTGYCCAPVYGGSTMEIHKTTNGGTTWIDQDATFTGERFMAIWIVHPDTVYISGNTGHILKTVNGGNNWVTLTTNTTEQLWGLQFVNSFTGYAAGSNGLIIKTTNAGANWVPQSSTVPNALSCVYFRNENTGYVSGFAVVVKTTNAGATWTNLNAPFINGFENFAQITFTDDNTGYYISGLGRIEKTTNAGTNWTLLNTGSTEQFFGIYFTSSSTAYVCGNNGVLLYTTDAGANWSPQSSGLTEILTSIYFTSPLTGYISTWFSKVLKTTNGGFTFIEPINSEVPNNYSLGQNFPNPFNPETKIRFSVPVTGTQNTVPVRLIIYNMLGNGLETLVNDNLIPGNYETQWTAGKYPSGVYYYTLSAGNYSETKKMILLK